MDLDLGLSNLELAKRFGVSEGTIRYHKKKTGKREQTAEEYVTHKFPVSWNQ